MADAELEEVSRGPSRRRLRVKVSDWESDQASSPCAAPAAGWLGGRCGAKSGWESGGAAEVSIFIAKGCKEQRLIDCRRQAECR